MSDTARENMVGNGTVPDGAAVRKQLGKILESSEFKSSKRCQEFLRFVVDKSLSGHVDDLKERTIGVELLGRTTSYDPSTDATVRVKAGEVRKRLHMYYSGPGSRDELRIDLPAGGYVPEFSASTAPAAPPELPSSAVTRSRWFVPLIFGAIAGLCVASLLSVTRWRGTKGVLDQFWAPALNDKSPVLLCISPVPVYGLHPDVETGSRPAAGPQDFVALPNSFVGGGDVLALGRLTSMFAGLRHSYSIRLGNEVSFHDLKDSPSILIGYSYTKWNELTRGLRFLINTSQRPFSITDNGGNTRWTLNNLKPDRSTDEDYAIVARLMHPDTDDMVVILAGMTQYGSEAASDLVTDPVRLQEVIRQLPAGWQKKNLELVLHVRVIAGAPGAATVVATHVWQ